MDAHYHGIFLRRIEILWVHEPSLDAEFVALPVQALGLSPRWQRGHVVVGELVPVADAAEPDIGRELPGVAGDGAPFAVIGDGNAAAIHREDGLVAFPQPLDLTGREIQLRDGAAPIIVLAEQY